MQVIELIARALIMHKDKLLLCHKIGAPWYFLPGGHVEFGENAKRALGREMYEELGVNAAIGDYIGTAENGFVQDGKKRHELNLIFYVTFKDARATSQEDHIGFVWVDREKMNEKQIYPVILKSALWQWIKDRKPFWTSNIRAST